MDFSGDACHPMLPYLAQGANSALEDGAVLGLLLGHIKTKEQLPQALRLYEKLRKARGDAIARETFKQVSQLFLLTKWTPDETNRDSDMTSTCLMDQSRRHGMSCLALCWEKSSKVPFQAGGSARKSSPGCTDMTPERK
jgi:hypothetical protein